MPSAVAVSPMNPLATTMGSSAMSSVFWTGAHWPLIVASRAFQVAKSAPAKASATSSAASPPFWNNSSLVANRGSSSHSGWPRTVAASGQ